MRNETDNKRAALIHAAMKLFSERGFHGTPTAMISKEAGVSSGILFHYFSTKEDLINATYYDAKARMAKAVAIGIDDEPTAEGKVRRMLSNNIRWSLTNPQEFMFIEQFSSSPYITRITKEELEKDYEFFHYLLDECIREGKVREMNEGLLPYMIRGAITAAVKKFLREGHGQDVDVLIDEVYRLIWDWISAE
jgi:AcrR family transcriptional regulator